MNIINAQVEVLKEALKKKNPVIYGVLLDNVIIGKITKSADNIYKTLLELENE